MSTLRIVNEVPNAPATRTLVVGPTVRQCSSVHDRFPEFSAHGYAWSITDPVCLQGLGKDVVIKVVAFEQLSWDMLRVLCALHVQGFEISRVSWRD